MKIEIEKILKLPRLRVVSTEICLSVALSMSQEGQLQAITLSKESAGSGYILIDGAHRLAAAKLLGWRKIRADVLPSCTQQMAKLMEANCNLARAGDTLLSKAVLLWEGKQLYEKQYPHHNWGGDRRSQSFLARKRGTDDQMCENSHICNKPERSLPYLHGIAKLQGVSERTLKEYVQIAKTLGSKHCKMILQAALKVADHGSHLKMLMRLEYDERERVILLMTSHKGLDFPDALGAIQQKKKSLAGEKDILADRQLNRICHTFCQRLDRQSRHELVSRLLSDRSKKFSMAVQANGYRLVPISLDVSERIFEGQDA